MTAPLILAFDCAGPHCCVALLRGGVVETERFEEMTRGQAERLMPLVEDVLAKAGVAFGNIDAVAVGVGPGNFTGLRIALAAARGLGLGLGIPAIGVSTFEMLYEDAEGSARALVTVRGPRDAVYVQAFADGRVDGAPWQVGAEGARVATEPDEIVGEAVDVVAGGLPGVTARAVEMRWPAAAGIAARIAARRIADGERIDRPSPLYVRAPDAAPARPVPEIG